MSLMAGLTVLVKIIRSDVRVSFVSGPVTSQSVGSIVIEADPSLSFVVPVSHPSIQSHPTISHYKEPQRRRRDVSVVNGRKRNGNLFGESVLNYFFIFYTFSKSIE